MPNGAVALQLVEPVSPSIPAPTAGLAPAKAVDHIGPALADAVRGLLVAGMELACGGLSAATRREGALRIYKLHEIRQTVPEIDFSDIARRQGLLALRQCIDGYPDLQQHYVGHEDEATIAGCITEILWAVDEVARFEKAMAN